MMSSSPPTSPTAGDKSSSSSPDVAKSIPASSPNGTTNDDNDNANEKKIVVRGPKKRWAPKVRTGCITCRARRVKCDEGKPACHRCSSTNRQCHYKQDSTPVINSQLRSLRPAASPNPPTVDASSHDLQMFYMFRMDTTNRVSGLYDQPFWNGDILRAARQYPAIWHANLALASIQRWKIATCPQPGTQSHNSLTPSASTLADAHQYYIFSLRHYNIALRHLMSIASRPDPSYTDKETLLMSEILCIGINSLMNNFSQASIHAQNAIALFHQWQLWLEQNSADHQPGGAVLRTESLSMLITNFQTQFVNRLGGHTSVPLWQDGQVPPKATDEPFRNIDDAYASFMPLFGGLVVAGRDVGDELASQQPQSDTLWLYKEEFLKWAAKFNEFCGTMSPTNPDERRRCKVLEVYMLACQMYCSTDTNEGIHTFDQFAQTFDYILSTLEQLYEDDSRPIETDEAPVSPPMSPTTAPGFSFSMSICQLLCWVSATNRDHAFRVRAIALLRRWRLCDGLLESNLVASMIEACMEIEEHPGLVQFQTGVQRCPCVYQKFICSEHRLRSSELDFVGDGVVMLRYATVADARAGKPQQTQELKY